MDSQIDLECTKGWWYFVVDGDDIGNQAALPLLKDQEKLAGAVSKKIHKGQQSIQTWVESVGGEMILEGGDNAVFKVECDPEDNEEAEDLLDDIEVLRGTYETETGFTLSVGMGFSPSSANKSLLVAKERGKNQTVVYDEEVEEEYLELLDNIAQDTEGIHKKKDQVSLYEVKGKFRPRRENSALSRKTLDLYKKSEKKDGWPRSSLVLKYAEKVSERKPLSKGVAERLLHLLKKSKRSQARSGNRAVKMLGGSSLIRPLEKFLQADDKG